ncbi:hypothetical protein [Winogradskyella sp.]|uniref:hypothetical protein n=1 Tax=Winogradskyella sp. TaxID=1883156 RepID=UPI002627A05F|nr:hypothetical protein [Winogradskyella sp.]
MRLINKHYFFVVLAYMFTLLSSSQSLKTTYSYPIINKESIQRQEDKIIGQWKGPEDVVFEVVKRQRDYIANVINPGKIEVFKKRKSNIQCKISRWQIYWHLSSVF